MDSSNGHCSQSNCRFACPSAWLIFHTCTHTCPSPHAVPIVTLISDSATVVEGKSAEVVVIHSGDPGIEVFVMSDEEELTGASINIQCTFAKNHGCFAMSCQS